MATSSHCSKRRPSNFLGDTKENNKSSPMFPSVNKYNNRQDSFDSITASQNENPDEILKNGSDPIMNEIIDIATYAQVLDYTNPKIKANNVNKEQSGANSSKMSPKSQNSQHRFARARSYLQ